MANDIVQSIKQNASSLYKNKQYKEALDLYRKLYSKYKPYCDEWDARYYAWCIYRLEIKGKKDEDIARNESIFFKAANAILNLASNNNDYAYIVTVFKVLDYLKSKEPFPAKEILTWTGKLDPAVLKIDCFSFQDKEGKTRENSSNKEKYYSLRTKALEKNKEYKECLRLSEEALSILTKFHHDNDIWFKWRAASCKGHLGQKEQAIEELKQILSRKKDWYIQHEIATFCLDLKRFDEALKYAVDAALNYGEAEKKWKLFFLLGNILQAQAKSEEAKKHILLSYQLRNENKWKIPQELQLKITEFQINVNNLSSSRQIYSELRGYWQSVQKSDLPRLRGRIKNILSNNLAGFIGGENNKDYYFNFRDFNDKESEVKIGLQVEFSTGKSYDKKKERESERAVDINILKS